MTRSREVALCALAGLMLASLLSIRIAAPWQFVHDDNGAWYQAIATAHIRAGLSRTHGQDFWIRRSDGQLVPYLHHPPLLSLAIAGAYRLTGRSDPLITRLVPATFHMLGWVGFCVLAGRVFPNARGTRVLAAFLYALVPMSSFFGKMPDHEPIGLCWVVWGLVAVSALRVRRSRVGDPADAPPPAARGAWLAAGVFFWSMAGFSAWAAYAVWLAVGALLVLEWRRPASLKPMVSLACAGFGSLALVLAQIEWAGGLHSLAGAGGYWSSALRDPVELARCLGRILQLHRIYFANLPAVLFLGWLVLAVRDEVRGRRESGSPQRLLLAGTAGCALWVLAFAGQAAVHGYTQFWLLPFESLAAADATVRIWRSLGARRVLRAVVAVIAAAIVLASTAVTLYQRYTRPGAYAVKTAAWLEATYMTRP